MSILIFGYYTSMIEKKLCMRKSYSNVSKKKNVAEKVFA